MNHPKTEHKVRKPQSHSRHEAAPAPAPAAVSTPAPAPAAQTNGSAGMIEACDRLGQKLDDFAGILREQLEAWRQARPADVPHPAVREAGHRPEAPVNEPSPTPTPFQPAEPNPETPQSQEEHQTPSPSARPQVGASRPASSPPSFPASLDQPTPSVPTPARADEGTSALAGRTSSLIDTLAQADGGRQDQAAGVGQALEAIMGYLENQAATTATKVDVAAIMDRLRALEERQQTLQSQIKFNR